MQERMIMELRFLLAGNISPRISRINNKNKDERLKKAERKEHKAWCQLLITI